jgi:hypothetical protein
MYRMISILTQRCCLTRGRYRVAGHWRGASLRRGSARARAPRPLLKLRRFCNDRMCRQRVARNLVGSGISNKGSPTCLQLLHGGLSLFLYRRRGPRFYSGVGDHAVVLRCENQQVRLEVRVSAFGTRVRRRIRIRDRDFDCPPDALERRFCLTQNGRIDSDEDCHDDEEFFRHEFLHGGCLWPRMREGANYTTEAVEVTEAVRCSVTGRRAAEPAARNRRRYCAQTEGVCAVIIWFCYAL